jgi:tetratricopeptide (TPR) repeat protein
MDLPVWQALYEELRGKGFVVITLAFDSAGAPAAEPWIKAANPTYPCLIDRRHIVAELYDMVNVPTAVWINEEGRIVRPSEPAGVTDAFRTMDHKNFSMPPEAMAELMNVRKAYQDAIRDWVSNGALSKFALSESEVLRRMHTPNDDHVRAAANFRLGEYLAEQGHLPEALPYFEEAKRLRPESWSYKRQAWALEDPMKPGGPEFWAAVDGLGKGRYYPKLEDI